MKTRIRKPNLKATIRGKMNKYSADDLLDHIKAVWLKNNIPRGMNILTFWKMLWKSMGFPENNFTDEELFALDYLKEKWDELKHRPEFLAQERTPPFQITPLWDVFNPWESEKEPVVDEGQALKHRIRNILLEATTFADRPNINDAFWKWFGDSKVVDGNGNPLVVYHGTEAEDFSVFKTGNWGSSFFADNPETIDAAGFDHPEANGYSRIIPCYLFAPHIFDVDNEDDIEKVKPLIRSIWGDDQFDEYVELVTLGNYSIVEDAEFLKGLKALGFDGFTTYEGGKNFAVFYPERQVKSVFNQGTWNPNDSDIMK